MEMKKVPIKQIAVFTEYPDGTWREVLQPQGIMESQTERLYNFSRHPDGKVYISDSIFRILHANSYKPLSWQQLPGYIWLADGPYFAFQIDFCEDGWSESDDNYMYMAQRNDADEPDCEYFLTLDEAKAHCEKLYREDMDRFVRFLC
jgi:hypothetical protein